MASTQTGALPHSSDRKLSATAQLAFLPTGVLTTLLGPMLPLLIARWSLTDTQAGNLFLVQFLAPSRVCSYRESCWRGRILPRIPAGIAVDAGGAATILLGSVVARDGRRSASMALGLA